MDTRTSRALPVGMTAEFHPPSSELRVDDRVVRLRPQTAAVLTHLLLHPDRVVGKEELLQAVWPDVVVTENSLAQCIAEIRRELGGANQGAIETVPRRGYRFHPPPAPDPGTDAESVAVLARVDAAPTQPLRRRLAYLAASGCAVLVAAAAFAWNLTAAPPDRGVEVARMSIAVLPLDFDAKDARQAELAQHVADGLTRSLAQLPGAQVIARGTSSGHKADAVDARRIGRELGVRYVVEGGVVGEAGRLLVDLRLVDADTGVQRWADRVDLDTGLLDVDPGEVPGRVAQIVRTELVAADIARPPREARRGLDANDLALRASVLSQRASRGDNADAQALARQAIALDPESIFGWQVLAASVLLDRVEGWAENADDALDVAEAAIRRALTLKPDHPRSRAILGAIMALRGRYAEALAALEAALATGGRQDALAHEWLGITYLWMGKPRQAVRPLQAAIWLSPRSPRLSDLWRTLAMAHWHIGDLCLAQDHAWSAVRAAQAGPRAYETLAVICMTYGDRACEEDALAELRRIAPLHGVTRASREASSSVQPDFVARQLEYVAALRMAGLR